MFEELNGVFTDVIRLAHDHRVYYEKYGMKSVTTTPDGLSKRKEFENSSEGKELSRREKELDAYLSGLDFEVIKTLQVIMYLGITRDYDEQDNPEEIYHKEREAADAQGWDSKDLEIYQMTGKLTLDQDLQNGLRILGIR
ncbi:hypothetical protein P9C71_gp50 [Bacillus phage F16Ba]|uniref:DUF3775 domain-containing protein n=1 Tax=Bacillus phage F16Ba TaxID=2767194 RepID=A0A7S6NKK0_9CAUD|nr:hypothetical protein P9C71_gp50 [Bacillus phage F16Ba]QOQ37180.1 hypothetical protein F16Ba_050 [Bacillus phage F16Ba]